MEVSGKHILVTGGANGIGRALCRAFATAGARRVVVADVDEVGAREVADEIGGIAAPLDVRDPSAIASLVERSIADGGPIDLLCSNAGILVLGGPEVADEDWQRIWEINVMAHVWAARAVLPSMLERGAGYLLNTASAAGLLSQIGSAPYSVTKSGAVAFAEWLSITYGDRGIAVSVLCPQAVRTAMTEGSDEGGVAGVDGMLEPEAVAGAVLAGLRAEQFLILPHPEVKKYVERKATDPDRWLKGMRRLQALFTEPA
jgi:NAD(P)-dependent dehydrogenase (short-subunit alcohol dehydrogenase family)